MVFCIPCSDTVFGAVPLLACYYTPYSLDGTLAVLVQGMAVSQLDAGEFRPLLKWSAALVAARTHPVN